MNIKKRKAVLIALVYMVFMFPVYSNAMHIMEGFLDPLWCEVWAAASLPFVLIGFNKISKILKETPEKKLLLALCGAFIFVLSALKLPSVTGSTSHPTGTGLAAILFGPAPTAVLGLIVLVFQALFLAHGGLSTLGANTFSMAVAGPLVAYAVFKSLKKVNVKLAVFMAAFLGDLLTYVVTSAQLAIGHPDPVAGFMGSFVKFLTVFAVTQIPLAISEGLLTLVIYNVISDYQKEGGYKLEEIK